MNSLDLDQQMDGLASSVSVDSGTQPASLVALVTAARFGTTTMGVLFTAVVGPTRASLAAGALLIAYSLWRTFVPVAYGRRGWRSSIAITLEVAVAVGSVMATEGWDSPFIFSLFTPVIAAGFARGLAHALRIAVISSIAVFVGAYVFDESTGIRPVASWTGELVLVAGLASYGRWLHRRAERATALSESERILLTQANDLLVNLNRLSRDLPASFDLQETISGALGKVRDATQGDLIAVLLIEPLSTAWTVAMSEGARLPDALDDLQLPPAARLVARGTTSHLAGDLDAGSAGFAPASRSGLYAPLWAGNRQIGLLVVESLRPSAFDASTVQLVEELRPSIALTIDNARWFERLRSRGAAQERNRIARDLHDRIGQGIAYVAFELDRLSGNAHGLEIEDDLERLRYDARTMVRELRETLYDLRTDVSDAHDLVEIINEFLGRVAARSAVHTYFSHRASRRLPLSQEREVWRVCQEAIVNAERHADAGEITVRWEVDDTGAEMTVTDDGVGIASDSIDDHQPDGYGEASSPGRPSYGLTGMRERASILGANIEVTPSASGGTTVRLTLGARRTRHVAVADETGRSDDA